MTKKDSTRIVAIELLRSGLATQAEVAVLAGVSRQAVAQWIAGEGLDTVRIRKAWLAEAWKHAQHRYR